MINAHKIFRPTGLRALIANPIGPDISQARELWADLKKDNAGMIGVFNE